MKLFGKEINKRKLRIISRTYYRKTKDYILGDIFGRETFPEFVIAGVQKSGTTALAYYLSQHPALRSSYVKEVSYFTSTKYSLGDDWYRKQFPTGLKKVKYFEATPDYIYSPSFAERLYKHNKNIKIIIILRNPIDRAYSAWNMFKEINNYEHENREKIIRNNIDYIEDKDTVKFFTDFIRSENYPSFNTYMKMEFEMIENKSSLNAPGFIRYGMYYEQIKRLIEYFSLDQILIIENNELRNNRVETLTKTFDFLGVNKTNHIKNISRVGVRKYEEPIKESDKEILRNFYRPYNDKLFKLIGRNFDWDN